MKKKSIAFVDHAGHEITRSREFFCDLVKDRFEIERFYISPSSHIDNIVIEAVCLCDMVIIWQMDFLAPIFLARGKATIVVPMYDGSANMPDMHWLWSRKAYFICFSWTLYDRLRRLGCKVHLVKYFIEPVQESKLPVFDEYNVFLWQRRPEDGINGDMVVRLLGDQISSIHIHDAPDSTKVDGSSYYGSAKKFPMTVSRWSKSPVEYNGHLSRANIFVSPRRTEGIGMAHLEAMARGMLVLAHDQPTHTEYLANWVNGILFNADDIGFTQLPRDLALSIARAGWLTVVEGRRVWKEAASQVVSFIANARPSQSVWSDEAEIILEQLPKVYVSGPEKYIEFLNLNCRTILKTAGFEVTLLNDGDQKSLASIKPSPTRTRLFDRTIDFSFGGGRPYLLEGWDQGEEQAIFLAGRVGDIGFAWIGHENQLKTMIITCRSCVETTRLITAIIVFNSHVLGSFKIKKIWQNIEVSMIGVQMEEENRLSIYVDDTARRKNRSDRSLMIQKIHFSK